MTWVSHTAFISSVPMVMSPKTLRQITITTSSKEAPAHYLPENKGGLKKGPDSLFRLRGHRSKDTTWVNWVAKAFQNF